VRCCLLLGTSHACSFPADSEWPWMENKKPERGMKRERELHSQSLWGKSQVCLVLCQVSFCFRKLCPTWEAGNSTVGWRRGQRSILVKCGGHKATLRSLNAHGHCTVKCWPSQAPSKFCFLYIFLKTLLGCGALPPLWRTDQSSEQSLVYLSSFFFPI
jgi:hypothetical protein